MIRTEDLRVGVDLADVAAVAASIERFGARYLERIYTPHELDCARTGDVFDPSSLAARFAAKEATLKVLAPNDARPSWRSIEVRRAASGACTIALHDQAAELAQRQGITALAVSMTHESQMAASVVIATTRPSPGSAK